MSWFVFSWLERPVLFHWEYCKNCCLGCLESWLLLTKPKQWLVKVLQATCAWVIQMLPTSHETMLFLFRFRLWLSLSVSWMLLCCATCILTLNLSLRRPLQALLLLIVILGYYTLYLSHQALQNNSPFKLWECLDLIMSLSVKTVTAFNNTISSKWTGIFMR